MDTGIVVAIITGMVAIILSVISLLSRRPTAIAQARLTNQTFYKEEYEGISEEYAQLKTDHEQLQQDYSQLKNDYDQLKRDHDKLKRDYDNLAKRVTDLEKVNKDKTTP